MVISFQHHLPGNWDDALGGWTERSEQTGEVRACAHEAMWTSQGHKKWTVVSSDKIILIKFA